jgi:flavin-binding protein dodecin
MSVVKVIEVISEGSTLDEAVKNAVKEAARTVDDIKQVDVVHVKGIVENGKVTKFSVNCKISFVVHHEKD